MWIVAIGWIYVVALMAATEPTVFAGIMTFFGYCVLPLSIVFYLTGSKRRRARRESTASAMTPGAPVQANGVGGHEPTLLSPKGSDSSVGGSDGSAGGCAGDVTGH